MKININAITLRNFVKKTIFAVISLIILLLIIIGVRQSDFTNIKKYDSDDKSPREVVYNPNKITLNYYTTKVTLNNENSLANLGDFVFNVAGDRKLIANISLKYKSNNTSENWIQSDNNAGEEIVKKSVVLRDAIINTMIGNHNATVNSKKMRNDLKENINKNLSSGEIEEVYFNSFILQ
ncbi:flagellar basal body-associated FliL family protein [Candidatus Sulfurimonas marisnigri]|uniref:Flagellar protein FliL n=1 Tax=Candidatus Sulfurimonas marisnigri TaxID=2740405 RepID=A0A7S7RPL2_9BACT|nr:flagellar basal body-associated FliL family protein [Candidatus Sulfurimonas marisnigri]QOY53653.1 flagellar basal body-associated FliL family protein [Candidatus Sulfurimonas marisnigri]